MVLVVACAAGDRALGWGIIAPMARIGLVVLGVLLVAAAVAWFVILRPGVSVAASEDPDVTIECTASLGLDEDGCRGLGDAVLAGGPPTTTFELEDVARIRIDGGPFGGDCRVEYFLGRYPDEVAWTQEGACGVSSSG